MPSPVVVSEVAAMQIAVAINAQTTALTTNSAAQSAALLVELERLRLTISGLVVAVNTIADSAQGTGKSISDLNSALGSIQGAVADASTTQQTLAANIIKTNNFDMSVAKQGLIAAGQSVPEQLPILEQIKESVKDGFVIHQQVVAQNYVSKKITDSLNALGSWITGMEAYQTVTSWLTKQKDAILSVFGVSNPKSVANNTAAIAGTPPMPGSGV
jgi:hypothetical protein